MVTEEKLFRVEEVALGVGVSIATINFWYRWKRTHPEHELAKLLPDFIQSNARQTRYWKQSDVWKIIQFRQAIPHGRNGVLGDVTQTYARRRKNNGKI